MDTWRSAVEFPILYLSKIMLSEILIDHTTLHSLTTNKATPKTLPFRIREISQLTEYLLLADNVWLSDMVSNETMGASNDIINLLSNSGFTTPRGEGVVKIANFSEINHLDACKEAAPSVFDLVSKLDISNFESNSLPTSYSLRPKGVQELDFLSVASLEYGSNQADEMIATGIRESGWKATACLSLLNIDLHEWLQKITSVFKYSNHPVYQFLNIIYRWQINEALARQLDNKGKQDVNVKYTPSYGRGVNIEKHIKSTWQNSLIKLEKQLNQTLWETQKWRELISTLSPTSNSVFPLFGLWVIQQLKVDCSKFDLLNKIAELRSREEVLRIKECAFSTDGNDIKKICDEISREMRLTQSQTLTKTKKSINLKAEIKVPIIEHLISVVFNGDKPLDILNKDVGWLIRRKIKMRKESTILTGFLEDGLFSDPALKGLGARTISILSK